MATESIIQFGKRHAGLFQGPFLEVGSKIQPGYTQSRPREIHDDLKGAEWFGVDIEAGEGVDAVANLCDETLVESLGWNAKFGTIHCHCVLEHVPEVFALSRSLQRALRPGGTLYVSVPFAWRIHRIPVDMWRFTPQSLDYLFPKVEFLREHCGFSTRIPGDFSDVEHPPELPLGSQLPTLGPAISFAIKFLRKLKLDRGYFQNRALLVETNLMMIGTKRETEVFNFYPSAA